MMLDSHKIAELEQAVASVGETMPPLHWALFKGYKEQGFTDEQAMRLVTAWIQKPLDLSYHNES